ncbi:MAG: hypothetical protein L0Y56_22815 [Nitrospira sp.]|nr:hypothetical protein [Nitrospira sp.]
METFEQFLMRMGADPLDQEIAWQLNNIETATEEQVQQVIKMLKKSISEHRARKIT